MPTATRIMRILDCNGCSEDFVEHRKFLFYFVVIWNLFEQKKMNRNASISEVDSFVNTITNIERVNVNEIFKYFQKRYVLGEDASILFERLNWRNNTRETRAKEETYNALRGTLDKKNQIKAILCIVFRLRNNLFHGEKNIDSIYKQRRTFELVNSFMLDLLEV